MNDYLKFFQGLILVLILAGACAVHAQEAAKETSSRSSSRSRSRSSSSGSSDSSTGKDRGETTNARDRRRESSSKARETNSRSSSRKSKTGDKAADPKEGTKTVEASKKTEGSKGGKSGGAGARPPLDITFEMQADPETNIMYLESVGPQPSLNISVIEDKLFTTRVALYNAKSSEFSQFDVSLKYDPHLLQPTGVDDSATSSNLTQPSRVMVDKKRGLITMSGDFRSPRTDSFLTIAKIQWKALEPVAATPIQFINTDDHPSGVFDRFGHNILHAKTNDAMEPSANTGLLNATVAIEPPNGTIEMAEQQSDNPFSALSMATNISLGTAEGGMEVFLKPRKNVVQVGEDFLVDVMYRNPRRADMDTVKLEMRFDPAVLQVVDSDDGNWITRGVNIFDGAYHDELPFDFHRKNIAFNSTGLIQYDMGFSSRTAVRVEGVFATIRFRAIAPASSTPVFFVTNEPVAGADAVSGTVGAKTIISFLGFNLIGKPGNRAPAIHNAAVSVRP